MKTMLGLVLGLALPFAAPAAAQSPSDVAVDQARTHGEQAFPPASGWRVDQGPAVGSLGEDASETVEVRLRAGERYGIIGGCDGDCSDMDLEITDRSGNTLDSDYLSDDYPVLEVSAGYGGAYALRVSMHSCSVDPCSYAYIVYRMDAGGARGSHAEAARGDLARREAQLFPPDRGWSPFGESRTGSLDEGGSETVRLSVDAGVEYGVLATCDPDCSDVDLAITDRSGNTLDSDYLSDDYPTLGFRAAEAGGHTLEISMHACSASPCYYAYRVYRRGAGGGGVAGVATENSYVQRAREELARHVPTFFPPSEGWRITHEAVVRTLRDGGSEELTLTLSGGATHGIIATCGEDCDDLDLRVYDDAGNELDSDTAPDDYPVLEFRTPHSGSYRVTVTMYDCSVNPCYYAYEVYRR